MPPRKGYRKAVANKNGTATSTPRNNGTPRAAPTPTPRRSSKRSLTVKKIAISKEKRKSTGRKAANVSRDKRAPWEESDDDGVLAHYSNSDEDSDVNFDEQSVADDEVASDEDVKDGKDQSQLLYDDPEEKIFCPWLEMPEEKIPPLILPSSSFDLLVDRDHLFDTLEIYEILRAYCHTLQISPFLFEDFCCAIRSPNQSKILCEIHIAFLRLLFRDDEDEQTLYSVQDTNNSFNVLLQLLEPMTFAEILRQYAQSDPKFSSEVVEILTTTNYPFVELDKRIKVLKWLCDQFFETVTFKRLIRSENKIVHNEHCRDCGKQGNVLLCDGCEACYHMECTDLDELPHGKWLCKVCEVHEVNGIANCLMPGESDYRFTRRIQPLGMDRHGRWYWFLARRIFVKLKKLIDDFQQSRLKCCTSAVLSYSTALDLIFSQNTKENEVHYYSTLPQVYELITLLDSSAMEKRLCRVLTQLLPTIADHMRITLELTDERRDLLMAKFQRESPYPYLHVDNIQRMSRIVSEIVLREDSSQNGVTAKSDLERTGDFLKVAMMNSIKSLLCIENNQLNGTLWSGGLDGSQLLDFHNRLENEINNATNGGSSMEHMQSTLLEDLQRGFRLGFSDGGYRNYVNQYTTNDFAKSPYARAKDRDKKKYMCSRFSLCDEGEFLWACSKNRDIYATEVEVARCIQLNIKRLIERLPDGLFHRLWKTEKKQQFLQSLQNCTSAHTLKYALLQLERIVRKPIFLSVWWSSLGHTRLMRVTAEDRERRQKLDALRKKDEKALMNAEMTDDSDIVFVKYSRYATAPKHNIWRLKDEQFRVNGREKLGGWMWVSSTLTRQFLARPERPSLGIRADTTSLRTTADHKACRLEKIVCCLSTYRKLNEIIEVTRGSARTCYSPSCRKATSGTHLALTALSAVGENEYLPCYSVSCPRRQSCGYGNVAASSTADIVKAFKPFKQNPYDVQALKARTAKKTGGILGEDKPFPVPTPFKYSTKSGKQSLLILPPRELCKLARQGGLQNPVYIMGFHKTAKSNTTVWNYPCPRPLFDNCWRYMTLRTNSLHGVALQLRIMYACIRWSDLEPDDDKDEDKRVWIHNPDNDEVRTVVGHKEYPPYGYYEQYKIRVERYSFDDTMPTGEDDSEDYKTTSVKTLRTKYKRKNQKGPKEIYVKRRRTGVFEKWIDGVELKLFEIADYWRRQHAQYVQSQKSAVTTLSENRPVIRQSPHQQAQPSVMRYHVQQYHPSSTHQFQQSRGSGGVFSGRMSIPSTSLSSPKVAGYSSSPSSSSSLHFPQQQPKSSAPIQSSQSRFITIHQRHQPYPSSNGSNYTTSRITVNGGVTPSGMRNSLHNSPQPGGRPLMNNYSGNVTRVIPSNMVVTDTAGNKYIQLPNGQLQPVRYAVHSPSQQRGGGGYPSQQPAVGGARQLPPNVGQMQRSAQQQHQQPLNFYSAKY